MTDFTKIWVPEAMVLKGLGKNYGDRVGRESIEEAIRGPRWPRKLQKTAENRPKRFQKNPNFDHVLLLALYLENRSPKPSVAPRARRTRRKRPKIDRTNH